MSNTLICGSIINNAGCLHCWARTSQVEAGMGPGGGGVPGGGTDCMYAHTKVTDHKGEGDKPGSSCSEVPNCNDDCINKELKIGKDTGRWTPNNQCNSFIADIMRKCKCQNKCLKWDWLTLWQFRDPWGNPLKVRICVKYEQPIEW
jgi:hypothetical protein